jgi:hypothetical protein
MSLRDRVERRMRYLFYDDVAPDVIHRMGYRELGMWSKLSEFKLKAKYPNIEGWV